jgi:preprotein translocase subunit SecA
MDEQRKRVYGFRQNLLEGTNCRDVVIDLFTKQIDTYLSEFLKRDYGLEMFAAWAGQRLSAKLEPKDFRGMDFEQADRFARDQAERAAETHVQDEIDQNLAGDEEDEEVESEWNWGALARMAHSRWGIEVKERDLKQLGRRDVGEFLIEKARQAIEKLDLSEGKVFLDEDFAQKTIVAWAQSQFGLELPLEEVKGRDAAALKQYVKQQVLAAYESREAEYPVMAGIYRYTIGSGPQARLEREPLVAWARERFEADLDLEDLKSKQRDEIRAVLVAHSRASLERAQAALAEVQTRVEKLFGSGPRDGSAPIPAGANGQLDSLAQWLDTLRSPVKTEEISGLTRDQLEARLIGAIEDRYRPEMRRMERMLLLQIVDSTWKDHLLVMQKLRDSVGLQGYAQIDPKVEYKREGMKLFEEMWKHVGDRSTQFVFKIEQLNEEFVGSTWVETSATHAEAPDMREEFQQGGQGRQGAAGTTNSGQEDARPEPIRNRGQRVGRNDPCPCGSGKKYKNCHMRTGGV